MGEKVKGLRTYLGSNPARSLALSGSTKLAPRLDKNYRYVMELIQNLNSNYLKIVGGAHRGSVRASHPAAPGSNPGYCLVRGQ